MTPYWPSAIQLAVVQPLARGWWLASSRDGEGGPPMGCPSPHLLVIGRVQLLRERKREFMHAASKRERESPHMLQLPCSMPVKKVPMSALHRSGMSENIGC